MDSNVQLLISGYLDGELPDAQVERLARLLESDADSLDRFVFQSFIHSQLLDWMDQQRVQDHAVIPAFSDSSLQPVGWLTPKAVDRASNNGPSGARSKPSGAPRFRSVGAWAAVLLVAASISAITYSMASRPVIVGQLTEATGCRWDARHADQADIPVGTLLQNGQQLSLVEGRALITFTSGAQMLLEGPASVRLDSAMEVHLDGGRIAAKVPRHAIGFAVSSGLARFIDLGTEFTLSLQADKSFELHVFEGLVELWLDKRFGEAARYPVRVPEVRAVSFEIDSGDIENVDFQEGKQMPF